MIWKKLGEISLPNGDEKNEVLETLLNSGFDVVLLEKYEDESTYLIIKMLGRKRQ